MNRITIKAALGDIVIKSTEPLEFDVQGDGVLIVRKASKNVAACPCGGWSSVAIDTEAEPEPGA